MVTGLGSCSLNFQAASMYLGISNLNPFYVFSESFRGFLRTLANFAVGEFDPSEARRFSKGSLSRRRPFPYKPQFATKALSKKGRPEGLPMGKRKITDRA